jgi:sortase (surface protein transpeptidase)
MNRLSLKRRFVMTITITAVVVFVYTAVRATLYDPDDSGLTAPIELSLVSSASAHAVTAQSGDPARLILPALGINANVQRVTVSIHNTIAVPTNFTDVGWYAYSPDPGKPGTAIIDGHVDNGLALAGVFKHLSDAKVGDDIEIVTHGGATIHFSVIQIKSYPYQSTSTEAMAYPHPGSYLQLISCTGAWVPTADTYDHRIVVTAELVSTSTQDY